MSDPVANDIADAMLRAGKKHGLSFAQLMHEMVKLLAVMTKVLAERATKEPLTPAMAARLSTLGVAIGEPDRPDPWLYLFRLSDRRYFKFLGSKIEPITSTNDVPFSRWSPATLECTVAVTLVETRPRESEPV